MITNKKLLNTFRSWYIKPSTIFLPKIRRSHSRKGNILTIEYQDTSLLNIQIDLVTKLFPVTRPTRLRKSLYQKD